MRDDRNDATWLMTTAKNHFMAVRKELEPFNVRNFAGRIHEPFILPPRTREKHFLFPINGKIDYYDVEEIFYEFARFLDEALLRRRSEIYAIYWYMLPEMRTVRPPDGFQQTYVIFCSMTVLYRVS